MATTNVKPNVAQTQYEGSRAYAGEEAGSGWLLFAGTIIGLAGFMRIVDSIWAFSYKGALPAGLQNGVLGSNLRNYAWTWLIVGFVMLISSFTVLVGSQFARWVCGEVPSRARP